MIVGEVHEDQTYDGPPNFDKDPDEERALELMELGLP